MAKKLTKKDLVVAYKELDKVIGIEPPIEYEDLKQDEFEEELYKTYVDLVEEGDEFSKPVQATFDALAEKYGNAEEDQEDEDDDEEDEIPEPEEDEDEGEEEDEDEDEEEDEDDEEEPEPVKPAPKGKAKGKEKPKPEPKGKAKGKAKPEPEPEEDEDEDDEDEDEPVVKPVKKGKPEKSPKVEKPKKEVVEENPLVAEINSFDDRDDLVVFVKQNKESFKGVNTKEYPSINKLKSALLQHLGVKTKRSYVVNNPSNLPKVGVIAFIKQIIEESGKAGVDRATIIKKLSKKFPDRPVDGMKKTVFAQVPGQLTVHGWPVVKNKEGFFVKK